MRTLHVARAGAALVAMGALAACGGGTPTPPPEQPLEPIVREETVVLTPEERAALTAVLPDGTLVFTGDAAPDLEPGEVLVAEPSGAAPFGLLRRVTAVDSEGATLNVATEQATLGDALQRGSLRAEIALQPGDVAEARALADGVVLHGLTPEVGPAALEDGFGLTLDHVVWDEDGEASTKDDQVVVLGEIRFKPKFDASLDIDCGGFICTDLDVDLMFQLGLEEVARIGITGKGKVGLSFDETLPLASYDFTPWTFFVGPVPVVITPKVVLELRFDGTVGARVNYEASQTLTAVVGARYDDDWQNISDLDNELAAGPVGADSVIQVEANARALGALRGELLLYGVVGPTLEVSPWVRFDLRYPRDPVWRLYAGLTGTAGVKVDVFGLDDDFTTKVFEVSEEIASAGNTPPVVRFDVTSSVVVDVNAPIQLRVSVQDGEDGPTTCCAVTVRSSSGSDGDGGILGSGTGPGVWVDAVFETLGERTITATATDSDGATSQATLVVEARNSPPQVSSNFPFSGHEYYRGVPAKLRAASYDPNEPGQALACEALVWTSSRAEDDDPLGAGCIVEVLFDTAGDRTLTLTGTDSHGGTDTHSVTVAVLEPPDNLPPTVNVLSPADGLTVDPTLAHALVGTADDPEGQDVSLAWDLTRAYVPATGEGGQVLPVTPRADGTWAVVDAIPGYGTGCGFDEYLKLRLVAVDEEGQDGFDFVVLRVHSIC